MRRRDFIKVIGASAAAWPLAARAQQRAMPVVGILNNASPAEFGKYVAGFRLGLRQTGYVEGQNVSLEFRWAEGRYERLTTLAQDLVRRRPAVIFTTGAAGVHAVQAESTTIPVVFTLGDDPVAARLVSSMSRPGGNVTGISHLTAPLGAKRLEMISELVPKARVFAALENPNNDAAESRTKEIEDAARTRGQKVYMIAVSADAAIEPAFADLSKRGVDGLLVSADGLFTSRRNQLVALAARHSIPTIYAWREFPVSGGLISYGPNLVDQYRLAGIYTGRILNGEKPANLPVLQPTKFELVINLKTAKALGLAVPPTLLVFADDVIE